MRHILCGDTKVVSPVDKKRKRFSVSFPFRRRHTNDNKPSASSVGSGASDSPVSGIQLIFIDPVAGPAQGFPGGAQAAPLAVEEPIKEPAGEPALPAAIMEPQVAMAALQAEASLAMPAAVQMMADPAPVPYNNPPAARIINAEDVMTACTLALLTLFPNICPNYLRETSESLNYDYESITSHILDNFDKGIMYPQRAMLKRRREDSDMAADALPNAASFPSGVLDKSKGMNPGEQEKRAMQLFGSEERREETKSPEYITLARTLCRQAYPFVPHRFITKHLLAHDNCLLPALLALDNHITNDSPLGLSFTFKKTRTKSDPLYAMEQLPTTLQSEVSAAKKEALEEYSAALQIRQLRKSQREAEKLRKVEEATNFRRAQRDGTAKECECCFGDFAMNRMVHCEASLMHWFCRDCAQRMAESQIGLSKYILECMSIDGCKAGFSHHQRSHFLDQKTTLALERIEQEHVLRVAGIQNLETCPFCPFAAEYPPVEVNKEFVCHNPECEVVSCRLCRKETHIPKTCAESESENGPSVRLTIEEAMSAAMIRKCNKCGTPFIKEHGCNKMTCSRAGCKNVQCYICHKSCEYSHFDDAARGGKVGNCPLFEIAEQRHKDEVQAAEETTRQKLLMSNPGLNSDLLKIHMSDRVIEDERRREAQEADHMANWRR
ncbi:hypothetical protein SEPCBS57363_003922 [Sporothrix epigloea]|uniref:RING-type domain-containing protein n=1 Tax=Sporothrix epigloea TaxID=1892477 RepID=A0ABP0DP90_9PEZI